MTIRGREAWHVFAEQMERQGATRLDGMIPVAVIALSECTRADCDHDNDDPDASHGDLMGRVVVMWPPGLTREMKNEIIDRARGAITDGGHTHCASLPDSRLCECGHVRGVHVEGHGRCGIPRSERCDCVEFRPR